MGDAAFIAAVQREVEALGERAVALQLDVGQVEQFVGFREQVQQADLVGRGPVRQEAGAVGSGGGQVKGGDESQENSRQFPGRGNRQVIHKDGIRIRNASHLTPA